MAIALIVCTLITLCGVGFFSFRGFGRRPKVLSLNDRDILASLANTSQASSLLPQVGATITGDFFHRNEQIHALCCVENQDAHSVGLRIVIEVGKVPLKGIQPEATGQLSVSDMLVPFSVIQVDFPVVIIEIDPENARKADRKFFDSRRTFRSVFGQKVSALAGLREKDWTWAKKGCVCAFRAVSSVVPSSSAK